MLNNFVLCFGFLWFSSFHLEVCDLFVLELETRVDCIILQSAAGFHTVDRPYVAMATDGRADEVYHKLFDNFWRQLQLTLDKRSLFYVHSLQESVLLYILAMGLSHYVQLNHRLKLTVLMRKRRSWWVREALISFLNDLQSNSIWKLVYFYDMTHIMLSGSVIVF